MLQSVTALGSSLPNHKRDQPQHWPLDSWSLKSFEQKLGMRKPQTAAPKQPRTDGSQFGQRPGWNFAPVDWSTAEGWEIKALPVAGMDKVPPC